jgi:predicted acetyltransferase
MTSIMNSKSKIKKIPSRDIDTFVDIVANAYPGFNIVTFEDRKKMKQRIAGVSRDPTICHYGLYRGESILGGMRTYDFSMNLFSAKTLVGGVGLVAVDLLHKKEKICKELISYFIQLYRRKGASLVALYPFRPDFYRKMGFGYGTKQSEYRIKPADLPRGASKQHIRFLEKRDRRSLRACSHRYFLQHHGMFETKEHELDYFFGHPGAKTVVYKDGNRILGYLSFVFRNAQESNWLLNDVLIKEFVYENRDVFMELLTFLHTQLDQIHRVVFATQDEFFHFLPTDPRDGSDHIIPAISHETNVQGVGIMYRVVDLRRIFQVLREHNFNGQNYRLKINLRDKLLPQNEVPTTVHFGNGFARLKGVVDCDVEIDIDVSDFSSLIVGAVDYRALVEYGLSDISNRRYVDVVTATFRAEQKPICHTLF